MDASPLFIGGWVGRFSPVGSVRFSTTTSWCWFILIPYLFCLYMVTFYGFDPIKCTSPFGTIFFNQLIKIQVFNVTGSRSSSAEVIQELFHLHLEIRLMVQKSCTSWHGKYPIIYRVLYMPGGARFLSSTVFLGNLLLLNPAKIEAQTTRWWKVHLFKVFFPNTF